MSEALEGVLETGVCIELAQWECEASDYDAQGWLDKFGDRVGSGSAQLPDALSASVEAAYEAAKARVSEGVA